MTLFELFSVVLMGIIALFGIGVILGLILVGVIIINYFRWRHQEKRQPESGGRMGKRKYYFPPKAEKEAYHDKRRRKRRIKETGG